MRTDPARVLTGKDNPSRTRQAVALLSLAAITLLALALRLYGLDRKSVWFDESVTALFARQSIPQLINSSFSDSNPPLYYLLMHVWLPLARDDFWLRLPSAAFSTLTIPALALFGRSLVGWGVGLAAALLTAVAPFAIDIGQEARGYGLLSLLTVLSLWSLWEANQPGQGRWWIVFTLTSAAAIYTHNYALFLIAAEGLYALALMVWRRRWEPQAMLSFLAIGLLYAPWIQALSYQVQIARKADFWIARPDATVFGTTSYAFTAYAIPVFGWHGYVDVVLNWLVPAALVLSLASIRFRPGVFVPWLGLGFPLASAIGISLILSPIYVVRYGSFLVPLLWLCVAAGIVALPIRLLQIALTFAVAGALALNLPALYTDPGYLRPDLRQAAALVRSGAAPGDVVVLTSHFTEYPLEYYNSDKVEQVEIEDRALLPAVVKDHSRFWYVVNYDYLDSAAENLSAGQAHQFLEGWPILAERSGLGFHLYLVEGGQAQPF